MNSDVSSQGPRRRPSSLKDIGLRRRGSSKEKPVYTRRQVEDMLDIISRTFEERMVLFFLLDDPPLRNVDSQTGRDRTAHQPSTPQRT